MGPCGSWLALTQLSMAWGAPVSTPFPTRVGPFLDPTTRWTWGIVRISPTFRTWSSHPAVRDYGLVIAGVPTCFGTCSLFYHPFAE